MPSCIAVRSRFNRRQQMRNRIDRHDQLIGGHLVLMVSGNPGLGPGRYLARAANGLSAVSNFGLHGVTGDEANINAVDVYGGMVGAQYFFTPTLSIGGAPLSCPGYVSQFGGCVGLPSSYS